MNICKIKIPQRKSLESLVEKSAGGRVRQRNLPPAEPMASLEEGQKRIMLNPCSFALVDYADFEKLSQFRWSCAGKVGRKYAIRFDSNLRKTVYMHRQILGLEDGNLYCDHINGNRLDNRRSNLRAVTCSQNFKGFKEKSKGKSSKFRGVYFSKLRKLWIANIRTFGKSQNLGGYKSEIDAAIAYDAKASELGFFDEALNFPKRIKINK